MNTNELVAHIQNINAQTLAWVAKDPANRWASGLVEDLAHWAHYGVTTVAQFEHYMLVTSVYETHRSVWGTKFPWNMLMEMSDDDLRRQLVALERESLELQAQRDEDERLREQDELAHAEATRAAMQPHSGFAIGELVKL